MWIVEAKFLCKYKHWDLQKDPLEGWQLLRCEATASPLDDRVADQGDKKADDKLIEEAEFDYLGYFAPFDLK